MKDTFDLDSILEDERVLSAAGKYAETQPEPEDLSEANALGQEAMAHGITEVYGAQAALAYLKSGRFV